MDHPQSPPSSVRSLAKRLLGGDQIPPAEPERLTAACERICQGLHQELGPLITSSAFQALQWRAVYLAGREYPVLRRVPAGDVSRCSLEALREALPEHEQRQVPGAVLALLAHLVWILLLMLGGHLVARALRNVRPDGVPENGRALLEGSLDE